MNQKSKILLETLAVAVVLVGGLWVWVNQTQRQIIQEQVTITTDKTKYEEGENVTITVKNNLDESIWYYAVNFHSLVEYHERKYPGDISLTACPRQGRKGPKLFFVDENKTVYADNPCQPLIPQELKQKEKITIIWTQNITTPPHYLIEKSKRVPGKYKIIFPYYFSKEDKEPQQVYSNEFMIKEKITDKNYYLKTGCEKSHSYAHTSYSAYCEVTIIKETGSEKIKLGTPMVNTAVNKPIFERCIYKEYKKEDIAHLEIQEANANEIKLCIENLKEEKYCKKDRDCCVRVPLEDCGKKCINNKCE